MKFLKLSVVILILMISTIAYANVATFEHYMGETGIDYGYCIQETSDGGYIAIGKTDSNPSNLTDIFLVKYDASGAQEWYKTFGGSSYEWGKHVSQTADGGYILTGWTMSYSVNGNYDLWIIKTDADGNEEWNRVKHTPLASDGLDIKQTPDGGYIVAGEIAKVVNNQGVFDAWIIKTNDQGHTEWQKQYGGDQRDILFNLQLTADNGYVFLGFSISYGTDNMRDYWLIKTDSLGNQEWNQTYDGIGGHDWGRRLRVTPDGGYAFTGASSNTSDFFQVMLIKTDDQGEEQWRNNYGGSYNAQGRGLDLTSDGGYILSGSIDPYQNNATNGWLIKTDSDGNEIWSRQFGAMTNAIDLEYVQQASDGGFIAAGVSATSSTQSDYIILKVNETGMVGINDEKPAVLTGLNLSQNYPNPFNPSTTISYSIPGNNFVVLSVYDLEGRLITKLVNRFQQTGDYTASWNGKNMDGTIVPSGIYFYKLQAGEYSETRKMNFIK